MTEGGARCAPPSFFFQSDVFSLVAVSTVQMVDFVQGDLQFAIKLAHYVMRNLTNEFDFSALPSEF